VEKKKTNSAQLAMPVGELFMMGIKLKSLNVFSVIDEIQ
tara:strand:+ start:68 stop:184 length:117 start_codon:yes stop_codon:yes gene_type:complete